MSPEPIPELGREPLKSEFVNILYNVDQVIGWVEADAREPQFHYGPMYTIPAAAGELRGLTLFRERPAKSDWQYEILMQQADDRIVARAGGKIAWVPSHGYIASQDIMTGVRGQRLAAPTAAIFFDLVQRRANELNEPITIREEDANGRWIKHWEDILTSCEDDALYRDAVTQLATARAERGNWLRLFGPGGTLGYNEQLEKTVQPSNHTVTLATLLAVTLAPRLEHGWPIVTNEATISPAEVSANQSEQRQHVLHSLRQTIAGAKKS